MAALIEEGRPGRRLLPGSAVVVAALVAAGCSAGTRAPHRGAGVSTTTASSAPTTTVAAPSSTSAPPTTSAPTFPPVVVEAMAQFHPLPAGAEAPIRLPEEPGYVTAQTGGLGGQDNVTLVVAPQPMPVNSPSLSSAQTRELASFATTPTASVSVAQAQQTQQKGQAIATCQGASQPLSLADGTAASTCPTLDGAAIDWQRSGWTIQVVTLSGQSPSTTAASQIEATLSSDPLPAGAIGGFVSVQVPADASVGSSTTAAVEWATGADDYQVRSNDDPVGALKVAAAMRTYPGG